MAIKSRETAVIGSNCDSGLTTVWHWPRMAVKPLN